MITKPFLFFENSYFSFKNYVNVIGLILLFSNELVAKYF